jgi:TolB-like protein/Tfp pilus assembly protein PilF
MSSGGISLGDLLRLDRQQGKLICAGMPVDLKRKAFDVLCVLADAEGAVVSKDELLSRVWPDDAVEDNSLHVHVSALRKVLHRHAAGSVDLVTVPGKGYKLLVRRDAAGSAPGARTRGPVLAVLPFDTFGAQDIAILTQGMTEEISLALSRVRWLSVIGSTSVAAEHAREPDARALARSFGVDYVVQGSVRREGRKLRVTARLCEASGLTQLWGDRYERDLDDLFALQDEIAGTVVSAIEPGVQQAELARIARTPPANVESWERTLEAAALLRSLMPDGARRAQMLLEEALKRDPDYAWALALKAWCHHVIYSRGGLDPAHRDASVAAARAALCTGAEDALVLATSGLVLWFDAHELPTAFDLFDRALAISPSSFLALAASSVALAWSGRAALAAERAQHALRLNPFHPLRYLAWLGLASSRLQQDDTAGACEAAARAVEVNPGFSVPLAYLCAAQARAGDAAAARDSAERLLVAQPGFTISGFRTVVGVNPAVFDLFANAWLRAGVPA